ncbi:MAG: hypothetical protein LBJ98_05265 [Endomicrobium sp.]|nr:hypothetical protein [Endomicrobium sp.]
MKRLIILIALCFSITVLGHTVTREDCDRYCKICSNIPYLTTPHVQTLLTIV